MDGNFQTLPANGNCAVHQYLLWVKSRSHNKPGLPWPILMKFDEIQPTLSSFQF
jgi:hypothetical protein